MKKFVIILGVFSILTSCSRKPITQMWVDQDGNEVPVEVTQKGGSTNYNFGVIVLTEDTTMVNDTIK